MYKKILILTLTILMIALNSASAETVNESFYFTNQFTWHYLNNASVSFTDFQIYYDVEDDSIDASNKPTFIIKTYDINNNLLDTYNETNFTWYQNSSMKKYMNPPSFASANKYHIISSKNITQITTGASANHLERKITMTPYEEKTYVSYDNDYVFFQIGDPMEYLTSLRASPGYEEYFIYEQEQSGKIIAEFYKTFPNVTYQSNVDSNEYSKWKMQHTDFVEVYEYNDQSDDWSLKYKQYQGNWVGYQDLFDEIKIIASSQSISDGTNIYGPNGNVSVNLDSDADTYYKILTPPNNVSTIKNKVRFQIYVNMPMKKEFGILNREYLSTFAPRLYIKSNNIQNPNNINGYLPWIISPIYNSQSSLWWENNNQTNDYFKLVGHVTKNESFGRREIVYTIESDLSIGANNFTFNLEPQFVLISATGSHDVKNGDLISAAHSVTRVQSVDANNDGIDDNTGESLTDTKPVGDDVLNPGDGHNWLDPDGSSSIDGDEIAIGALDIFNGMIQFASAFTSSVGQIFGFLPPEILALIIFSLSTGVIIGIFKMLT